MVVGCVGVGLVVGVGVEISVGGMANVFKYVVNQPRWPPITSLGFWMCPLGGGENTTVGNKIAMGGVRCWVGVPIHLCPIWGMAKVLGVNPRIWCVGLLRGLFNCPTSVADFYPLDFRMGPLLWDTFAAR